VREIFSTRAPRVSRVFVPQPCAVS
jgi:hypothetical protein